MQCVSVFRVLDLLEDFVQTTRENSGLIKKKISQKSMYMLLRGK